MLRVLLENKIVSQTYKKTGIEIIEKSKKFNENIKFNKNSSYTELKNVIGAIAEDNTILLTFHSLSVFLSHVHPEEKIREDSLKIDGLFSSYLETVNINKNMYEAVQNVVEHNDFNKLTNEEKFFFIKLKNGYIRSGVKLKNKNEIKTLKRKTTKYINQINNSIYKKRIFGIHPNDLNGVPDDIRSLYFNVDSSLNRVGCYLNKYIYDKSMTYIIDPNIRRKLSYLYDTRGLYDLQNISHFKNLLKNRMTFSKNLNYRSHAEFKNDNSMLSDPTKIVKLLKILNKKIDTKYDIEIKNLLRIKKKFCKDHNINFDGKINGWDTNILIKQWKNEYGINEQQIKKYFVLRRTIPKILAVMGNIFNLEMIMINKDAYHKKVSIFEVHDSKSKEVYGYIYIDLFERKGKNNTSDCYTIQQSVSFPYDKKIQKSIVVVVENFPSNNGYNYEMTPNELFQVINKIGQSIQIMLTRYKTPLTSVGTERDCDKVFTFIIKHLFFNIDIIKSISSHKDTRKQLEEKEIIKILKSRKAGSSIFYKKQILICLFDIFIHDSSKLIPILDKIDNPKQVLEKLTEFYAGMHNHIFNNTLYINDGVFPPLSWAHLYDGRESLYHSYLISEIIACDIIHSLFEKGYDYIKVGNLIKDDLLSSISIRSAINKLLGREFLLEGFIEINELSYYSTDSIYMADKMASSINSSDINQHVNTNNDTINSVLMEDKSNYYIENESHNFTSND